MGWADSAKPVRARSAIETTVRNRVEAGWERIGEKTRRAKPRKATVGFEKMEERLTGARWIRRPRRPSERRQRTLGNACRSGVGEAIAPAGLVVFAEIISALIRFSAGTETGPRALNHN